MTEAERLPPNGVAGVVPDLRKAAERASRVLDQVATDMACTAQLIEWHMSVEEARDALLHALGGVVSTSEEKK